jgi:hypothetical protein
MFSYPIRILLIVLAAAAGAYQAARGDGGLALAYLAGCALLVWGYFRSGTVWLAFRSFRAGNVRQGDRLISQIRDPRLLGSQQRAYYEWIKGSLAAQAGDSKAAEAHFRESLARRLRTSNDRSLVEACLAQVLIEQGKTDAAREAIGAARGRQHKPQVGSMLDNLETRIGSR